jgi:hypothetical protein
LELVAFMQAEEERKQKAMAVGDTPLHSMAKIREATQATKSPYIVLSGAVHAGQSRDQFVAEEPELTEELVEKVAPLVGDKKVEFLLGVSKPNKANHPKVEGALPDAKRLRK